MSFLINKHVTKSSVSYSFLKETQAGFAKVPHFFFLVAASSPFLTP